VITVPQPVYGVIAKDPRNPQQPIRQLFSQRRMQEIMRDAIWGSVVASSAIEGEDFSDLTPPSADTIPVSLIAP